MTMLDAADEEPIFCQGSLKDHRSIYKEMASEGMHSVRAALRR